MKHSITIRMGAAHWDVTIHNPLGHGDTVIDMRKLDAAGQRKFTFELVKACRDSGRVVT